MLKRLIEILNEKGLDANSFFFLYSLLNNIEDLEYDENNHDRFILRNLNLVTATEEDIMISYEITDKGIELVKYVVKEIKKEISKEKRTGDIELRLSIKEWINEYRELFKGTKTGIMGEPKSCLDKMVRFYEEYPEYANKDLIFKATQSYIQSEVQSNYKYLQRADYFIYKITGKEEVSRLASYCSDVEGNVLKSNIRDLN